ncbi:phage tail family protein [Lederbergia sp. NSJ-179]|uniref:distal tail protein Dit n=1 Tax=Lederbergia sp. NSJ-179 TaxID=2931402 RepID=UPI001FD1AFFA|nr:distal tail protein Dit [Lederbergia sp. NSJ-179]MCJ7839985.1 phage tail family protein [Lederbergia sp. NSJ-179]
MPKRTFSFNGISKDWLLLLRGRTKPPFAPRRRNILTVKGYPGGYLESTEVEPLLIELPIGFKARDDEDALKKATELAEWLLTDEPAPLVLSDEPGRTYYALVQDTISDFEEIGELRQGKIHFLCLDPYAYGPEKTLTFPADIVTVKNQGTAELDPIFELTAKKKTTFAMISNGDEEYNLIGKPADVDEQLVNEKSLIFDERGDTINTWTSAGTSVDGAGKVTGTLVADGTGIVVGNYGTVDKDIWHGPALMKEISPIQDFEIEMRCRAETTSPNQTYRIEFYLFDENMNVLGKMAIWDNSSARIQYAAEARYGPFLGHTIHYPIYSGNYLKLEKHFHGMVRMRRIGKRFEFYVARLMEGEGVKHYDTLTKTYNDVANEYQGKLKYVQVHIGKYRGASNANLPRINAIKAYKHTTAKVDQTPYILDAGDVVTFDHKSKDILLNGESRKDLKNFGGSFFKLKEGENMLMVTPENSFDTKVKFQERFL